MTSPINDLRSRISSLPETVGEKWTEMRKTLLAELHYLLDRRVPNFLYRRKGAPRIEWDDQRDEEQLYSRLNGLQRQRNGKEFVRRAVLDMFSRITTFVSYHVEGKRLWLEENPVAA